jgi:hypothetical protein
MCFIFLNSKLKFEEFEKILQFFQIQNREVLEKNIISCLLVNKPAPCFLLFQHQDIHEHLRSLWDKLIHIFCIRHNLLFEEQKLFEQLYTHPKVPFLIHQLDKHEHIGCILCKYHKSLLSETFSFKSMFLFI